MKSKRLFLPTIILLVAVMAMGVSSVIMSIAKKPTVTEGEFPFSITYELDGETKTIQDVYAVHYDGNAGYNDTKTRCYVGKIGNLGEGDVMYSLKKEGNTRIELATNLHAEYLMGDPEFDYFDGGAFEPQIFYYDEQEVEYCDEETLAAHGVKLVSFEYPTPIENSFVFSHISIFSNVVIWPTLLLAFLALLLIIIFVNKEKDFVRKPIDVVSTVFNFIIIFIAVPFITFFAWFLDISGDNNHIINQTLYFVPALTVLGVAASVALRRKGYSKSALVVKFTGPVVFGVILLICAIL